MAFNPLSIASLGSIRDVPVTNGVNVADVLTTPAARLAVGSLDTQQVTAALAQTARDVNQASDVISLEKGVGKFGLTPTQLEAAGYLKPGTATAFLQNPADIQSVLGNPAVWTGKNNVGDVQKLLGDVNLQSLTQNEVMSSTLDGLKKAGALTGTENPAQLASLVNLGSKFGTDGAVSWIKGQAPADLINSMNEVAKNAQFSVDLVDKAGLDQQVGAAVTGFSSTVNREKIDRAFVAVIGDPKIPIPKFGSEEPDVVGGLAEGLGVARSALANLPGLSGQGLPNLSSLQGLASSAVAAAGGSLPGATSGLTSALSSAGGLASRLPSLSGGLAALPGAADSLPGLDVAIRREATSAVSEVSRSVRGAVSTSGFSEFQNEFGEGVFEQVQGTNVNAVIGVVQKAGTRLGPQDFAGGRAGTFVTKVIGNPVAGDGLVDAGTGVQTAGTEYSTFQGRNLRTISEPITQLTSRVFPTPRRRG